MGVEETHSPLCQPEGEVSVLSVCGCLVPALGRGHAAWAPEGALSPAAEQGLFPTSAIDSCIPEDGEGLNRRTLPVPGGHQLRHMLGMWLW